MSDFSKFLFGYSYVEAMGLFIFAINLNAQNHGIKNAKSLLIH